MPAWRAAEGACQGLLSPSKIKAKSASASADTGRSRSKVHGVTTKVGDGPPDATARPPAARRQPGHTAPSGPAGFGAEYAAGRQPAIKRHAVLWSARKSQCRCMKIRAGSARRNLHAASHSLSYGRHHNNGRYPDTARTSKQSALYAVTQGLVPAKSLTHKTPSAQKGQRVRSDARSDELVHTASPHFFEQTIRCAAFVQGHFIQLFIQQTLTHAAGIGGGVVQQKFHK